MEDDAAAACRQEIASAKVDGQRLGDAVATGDGNGGQADGGNRRGNVGRRAGLMEVQRIIAAGKRYAVRGPREGR